MHVPPSPIRYLCLLGVVWTLLSPAAHAQQASASLALQGRKNPFRPLVIPERRIEAPKLPKALPQVSFPLVPTKLPALPSPKVSDLDTLEYVGIAFDDTEAVAAVRIGKTLTFVRKGDQLDGATVEAITPHKLFWRRNARTIVKHLHRSSGVL